MRRISSHFCGIVLLTGFATSVAAAGSAYQLSYGGRLTAVDGMPVGGSVDLKLRFFDADADGHQLGADVDAVAVALTDGAFQVPVALDGPAFQAIFGGTGPVFVEVTDVTHAKTYPRQRFAAVPYALHVPVDGTTVTYDGNGQLAVASVPQAAVTGLGAALTAKADQNAVTPALAAKADTSALTAGLATKAPLAHAHAQSDVTGLTAALALKSDTTHAHTLAGDVTGGIGATVVGKLQGSPVGNIAPASGQVLKWDGTAWVPGTDLSGTAGAAESTSASNLGTGANVFERMSGSDLQFRSLMAGSGISLTASANDVTVATTPVQSLTEVDYTANGHKVGLKAPAGLGADVTFALPAADGAAGQVLKTDGTGTLSWVAQPAVPVATVAGRTGSVTLTTADVAESGSTNIYYSSGRARGAFTGAAPLTYDGAGGFGLPAANAAAAGYLAAADWTTFNSKQSTLAAATAAADGFLASGDWATFNGKQNLLAKATASINGYLASSDWTTFNGKQDVIARGTASVNGYLASTDWTTFNGKQATLAAATASGSGYLTSTDWATFNGKAAALGYAPVNRVGDTMTGLLTLATNGLAVGVSQLVVAGGNVGIGSTSPAAKLDVTGNASISGTVTAGGFSGPGVAPAGFVGAYAGSSAPSGWLLCDGSAVSRTTYAALFAVVSTTYGVGDGSTTFNLPDLRGRVIAGVDNMGGSTAGRITAGGAGITGTTLGAAGGAETHVLSVAEMPSHTHVQNSHTHTDSGHNHTASAINGGGAFNYVGTNCCFSNSTTTSTGYAAITATTATNQNTGGGGAHTVVQPTLMLNYIIKY